MFRITIKFNDSEFDVRFNDYQEALVGYNFLRMILEKTGEDYTIEGNFHVRGDSSVHSQRDSMAH